MAGPNITELRSLDEHGDGIIWELADFDIDEASDAEQFNNFIGSFSIFPVERRKIKTTQDDWPTDVVPSAAIISRLSYPGEIVRPLQRAAESFYTFLKTYENNSAQSPPAVIFAGYRLEAFRTYLETDYRLRNILDWVDQHDWNAILRGARKRDMAVLGVLNGHAYIDRVDEGCSYGSVIRLHKCPPT